MSKKAARRIMKNALKERAALKEEAKTSVATANLRCMFAPRFF